MTPAAVSLTLALLALALLALAAATGVFLRRASRARRELAESVHDQALRLDQRCDVLDGRLHVLAERQRIEHLFDLVALGSADGRLTPEVADRLRRHVLALRAESFVLYPEV